MKKKIDENKTYKLQQVVDMGVIPGTYPTVRNRVMEDMLGDNILKTWIIGEGRGKVYLIKGKNLIDYIEQHKG